jgi:hypothetical protein
MKLLMIYFGVLFGSVQFITKLQQTKILTPYFAHPFM